MDFADLVILARNYGKSVTPWTGGDANGDGKVNFDDLVSLARNYGRKTDHWDLGDFNYDGSVGFDDLVTLARHYSQKLTPAELASFDPSFRSEVLAAFASVPEPASTVFPMCGVLVAMRRRRTAAVHDCSWSARPRGSPPTSSSRGSGPGLVNAFLKPSPCPD